MMDDPSVALAELAELKAANRLEKSKGASTDDIDLEKVKQQRLEAMRLREEQ